MPAPRSTEQFMDRVAVGKPDECWPWLGRIDKDTGYGQVRRNYRLYRVHRYAYELHNGPIPAGHVIDHTCHNNSGCTDVPCAHRSCVNPAHLEAVTQSLNTTRGRSGEHNSAKTHCPNGHEYSPANTLTQRNGRGRRCRECCRQRSAVNNARQREKRIRNG